MGKSICTYDLKDDNGLYYEEMVLEWKEAAAQRRLNCIDCGSPVYLAAGPIKEPYFAHYDMQECDYGKGHESEELKKGKRLLYQLLKRSYPEGFIKSRYRMDNGMFSTLYCRNSDGVTMVIDFRLQNNSLQNFRLRDTFYQSNQIKPIYVMGIRQEKDTKQIDWYQSLIQSSMGYLAFLDATKECITLKKSFGYRLGKERKFKYLIKTYPMKALLLGKDGRMNCDFDLNCTRIEHQIEEEKKSHRSKQEQLKQLRELREHMEAEEARHMEDYRQSQQRKTDENTLEVMTDEFALNRSVSNSKNNCNMEADLNPIILEKCRRMIEEGNSHLVSKKYYDVIMKHQERNAIRGTTIKINEGELYD
jgi:competence CoiA-like predicted nuclease